MKAADFRAVLYPLVWACKDTGSTYIMNMFWKLQTSPQGRKWCILTHESHEKTLLESLLTAAFEEFSRKHLKVGHNTCLYLRVSHKFYISIWLVAKNKNKKTKNKTKQEKTRAWMEDKNGVHCCAVRKLKIASQLEWILSLVSQSMEIVGCPPYCGSTKHDTNYSAFDEEKLEYMSINC